MGGSCSSKTTSTHVYLCAHLEFGSSSFDEATDDLLHPLRVLHVDRRLLKLRHLKRQKHGVQLLFKLTLGKQEIIPRSWLLLSGCFPRKPQVCLKCFDLMVYVNTAVWMFTSLMLLLTLLFSNVHLSWLNILVVILQYVPHVVWLKRTVNILRDIYHQINHVYAKSQFNHCQRICPWVQSWCLQCKKKSLSVICVKSALERFEWQRKKENRSRIACWDLTGG